MPKVYSGEDKSRLENNIRLTVHFKIKGGNGCISLSVVPAQVMSSLKVVTIINVKALPMLLSNITVCCCLVNHFSLRPHGLQHTRLPCPSPSPRACSNSCPSESVMPSNHLILCHPLLLLPSTFPCTKGLY